MTSEPKDPSTIREVSHVLVAHADLLEDTSEEMVLEISQAVETFQTMMADHGLKAQGALRAQLDKVLAALQYQDILRQQIEPIRRGLQALEHAKPPNEENAAFWQQETLTDLMQYYVMQSQHDVHARVTGAPVAQQSDASNLTLF